MKKSPQSLHIFLMLVVVLALIGTIFIYSASSVFALEAHGSATYFVHKQLIGLALGLIALFAIQFISINTLQKLSPLFLLATIGVTSLTLLSSISSTIHGSSRWFRIGGFSFQPSEILKVAFVLYLATFLDKRTNKRTITLRDYFPLFTLLGISSIILLLQPDFGTTVTLFATTFILLFVASFPLKHILFALGSLIPVAIALVIAKPYRLQRVLTFLNPWRDPKGAGFQIIQSLIAIGSGGFWGVGIGQSKQKFFYLPMQHTDFIFSIIAEETGFFGCCILLLVFASLLYFGTRLAIEQTNPFKFFAILGCTTLITLQVIINIGVASGLLPTKGMGLPFISYGNTGLIANLLMVGIIVRMARKD